MPTSSTLQTKEPKVSYQRVFELLEAHHKWFQQSLPLIASENIPSQAVREAILSDFGNRYAEGWPGERVYAGCKYIDQVELLCKQLAEELFRVELDRKSVVRERVWISVGAGGVGERE